MFAAHLEPIYTTTGKCNISVFQLASQKLMKQKRTKPVFVYNSGRSAQLADGTSSAPRSSQCPDQDCTEPCPISKQCKGHQFAEKRQALLA